MSVSFLFEKYSIFNGKRIFIPYRHYMYEDFSYWSPRILCLTSLPPTNGKTLKWDLVQNGLNIMCLLCVSFIYSDLRLLRNGSKCLVVFPSEKEKANSIDVIKRVFRNKGYKIGIFDVGGKYSILNGRFK